MALFLFQFSRYSFYDAAAAAAAIVASVVAAVPAAASIVAAAVSAGNSLWPEILWRSPASALRPELWDKTRSF